MNKDKYLKLSLKKKIREEKAIQKESKRKIKWLIKVASKHIINSAVNDETYSVFKVNLNDEECDKAQDVIDNTTEICSGYYRFFGEKHLCRKEIVDKVKALKPFDALLVAKTKEEYELEQKQNKVIEECTGKDAEGLSDEERNQLIKEIFEIKPMLRYSFLFN